MCFFFLTWEICCISAYFFVVFVCAPSMGCPRLLQRAELCRRMGAFAPAMQSVQSNRDHSLDAPGLVLGVHVLGEGCGCPEHLLVPGGYPHPCPWGNAQVPSRCPHPSPHPCPHSLCLVPPFEGLEQPGAS